MSEKTKAVLIGGVTLGLLSAIPVVNLANSCCLWMLAGGLLTVYLYVPHSPTPLQLGDGVKLGALAGLIGAGVYLVIGLPLGFLFQDVMLGLMSRMMERLSPLQGEDFRRSIEIAQAQQSFAQKALIIAVSSLFNAVLTIVFALVGGALGVELFDKRRKNNPNAPPPPPDFGSGAPTASQSRTSFGSGS